jgi:hypothetical protein
MPDDCLINRFDYMKPLVLLFLLVAHFSIISAQVNLGDYFCLNVQYYQEGEEKYLGVSPELKTHAPGKLGQAMRQYPRRFRYILLNKSHFQNIYEPLYPDTNRINRLYIDALSKDSLFVYYFNRLASPFLQPEIKKEKYTTGELMMVAARFFYCDGVRKDSTITSHICITLNGLKDAAFSKDYTLLEAFCFEAIFENLRTTDDKPNIFVENFKSYIREAEQTKKASLTNLDDYLAQVRQYCFSRMESDVSLRQTLLDYYTRNRNSLPFTIITE